MSAGDIMISEREDASDVECAATPYDRRDQAYVFEF